MFTTNIHRIIAHFMYTKHLSQHVTFSSTYYNLDRSQSTVPLGIDETFLGNANGCILSLTLETLSKLLATPSLLQEQYYYGGSADISA